MNHYHRAAIICTIILVIHVAWRSTDLTVSVTPGWHTPVLSPWAIAALTGDAILLITAVSLWIKGYNYNKRARH